MSISGLPGGAFNLPPGCTVRDVECGDIEGCEFCECSLDECNCEGREEGPSDYGWRFALVATPQTGPLQITRHADWPSAVTLLNAMQQEIDCARVQDRVGNVLARFEGAA